MISDVHIGTALIIFLGYFVLDILSSWFIIALNKLQKWTTTALTLILYLGSGAGIYQYTHHYIYLIFAASGAALGNFVLITLEIRRQKKKQFNLYIMKNVLAFIWKYLVIIAGAIGKFLKFAYAAEITIGAFGVVELLKGKTIFGILVLVWGVLLAINEYKQSKSLVV